MSCSFFLSSSQDYNFTLSMANQFKKHNHSRVKPPYNNQGEESQAGGGGGLKATHRPSR